LRVYRDWALGMEEPELLAEDLRTFFRYLR
jgi:hypothetical protein